MVHPTAVLRARRLTPLRLIAAAVTVVLLFLLAAAAPPARVTTDQFHGVNWADPADNYADHPAVPSGLSISDSYDTTYAKAAAVIAGFKNNLGANTVRLPVNPYTVNGSFWSSYTGAIDAAVDAGFKVVLSYWEGTAAKDGLIDDTTAWSAMWSEVTAKYAGSRRVYFEPMNEPFGYDATEWADVAADWLRSYSAVTAARVFVSGTGYNDDVTTVCADDRLAGTFLSLHHYGFWAGTRTSYSAWVSDLEMRIGTCAARTVVDEWGAPMTTGLDYNGPIGSNNFIAYVQADTDTFRRLGIGSIYWPGLRTGDSYSMETLGGSGTDLTLTDNNASGVSRLRWAWNLGDGAAAAIRGVVSQRCLDVPGSSTVEDTQLQIHDCNGGSNQAWLLTPAKTLVVYGSLCLDVSGASSIAGAQVGIRDCTGTTTQQWNVTDNGTITSAQTGYCLDATSAGTANGTLLGVRPCTGASNQQWTRS
jgi:hypothetical protein